MNRNRLLQLPVISILTLFATLCIASSIVMAQFTDTTPPTLVGLSFTPSSLDTTGGTQTVTVRLDITDNLSGAEFTNTAFFFQAFGIASPSGMQSKNLEFRDFQLVSGTPLNGTWQATLNFSQFVESGTWRIFFLRIRDAAGNSSILNTSTLPTLPITSNQDLNPPQLTSLTFTPSTIDTSANFQFVTVQVGVTDNVSGVSLSTDVFERGVTVNFLSPTTPAFGRSAVFTLVSGTPQNGTFQADIFFPRFSQAGTWRINSLGLRDAAENSTFFNTASLQAGGFPTDLTVTSTPSDIAPPQIQDFIFSPIAIDTSASIKPVTATVNATDDISGYGRADVTFRSPSGGQRQIAFVFNRISGTPLNGSFQGVVNFPQFSEAGTWKVESIFYFDNVFNFVSLNTAALEARGFATNLVVVLPSQIPDGTITNPGAGGTVSDDIFGQSAQVTFPPGVLTTPTTVAIDVFQSPLDLPIPTGFSGPGTRFVNISLIPEPAFPLPAPGLTVVLPLVNPMTPGDRIDLYRVDPVTGLLVQAIGVNGLPVVGTVNLDGLSATFIGVSRLSIVVGLIPGPIIDLCIQDESNGNILRINSTTGDYQFTDCSGLSVSGTGSLTTRGCTITLQHTRINGRVLARIDRCQNKAIASIQIFSQGITRTISDGNMTNNSCSCQ